MKEISLNSIIKKYFTDEIYLELYKITLMCETNNNKRGEEIKNILTENGIPFSSLGSGTNRMAVLIDGYAVKIALDKDGMIDNLREMLYTKALQPYVVKVYECTKTGLIAVTEYVSVFTMEDYRRRQDEMRDILEIIAKDYFIGDVGIVSKNYTNWGIRTLDNKTVILDFAYIYSTKYNLFTCKCEDEPIIEYDENYVDLICPSCHRRYTFSDLRRRISEDDQEKEIGDISRLGYHVTSEREIKEMNPEFSLNKENKKEDKKKKKKDYEDKFVDLEDNSDEKDMNDYSDLTNVIDFSSLRNMTKM